MVKAMVLTKQGSPRDLEMLDFPSPKPGKGDIVADVELCGICGTDTHQVYGMLNFPTPNIIGHEWFGRVRELGEDGGIDALGGELRKGDRIATSIGVSRKDWYARNVPERQNISQGFEEVGIPMDRTSDDPPHLWGAFSEQVYLPSYLPVYKFPPGLEDREMVLVEPVAVATRAFKRAQGSQAAYTGVGAGTDPSQTVVVQGVGPVGLCHSAVSSLFGMTNIIAVDMVPERLEKSRQFGVDETIDMNEYRTAEEREKRIKQLTSGVGADVVFETAGFPEALEESFKLVRKGGAIVEVGNTANVGYARINPFTDICQKDIDLYGSFGYSALEYRTAMATLVKARKMGIRLGNIVSEIQPLESLPEQIDRQASKAVPGRIAIHP